MSEMSMYWEDFEVGKRYETYGRTVTEGDLSLFCAFVGYHVPLFINEEYKSGGGRRRQREAVRRVRVRANRARLRARPLKLRDCEGRLGGGLRAGSN